MVRWYIPSLDVHISIDSQDKNAYNEVKFDPDTEEVKEKVDSILGFCYAAFGHTFSGIYDKQNPLDMDSVLREHFPDLEWIEGGEIVADYSLDLPEGAVS